MILPMTIKYTFQEIKDLVKEKECTVISSKDTYRNTKTPITIRLTCCHEYTTTYNQFTRKCVYECNDCIIQKLKNNYNYELNASKSCINEGNTIIMLKDILNMYFDTEKNNEGCVSDFLIKPKGITDNKWLPIQLKTNNCNNVSQYSFSKVKSYPNMIVICIYIPETKIWIFNGSLLTKINTLSIGKETSKYGKYEINKKDLVKTLQIIYDTEKYNNLDIFKYTKEYLNIPKAMGSIIEHNNRVLRENIFKDLYKITYPEYDSSKNDCFFNDYTIQDKPFKKRHDCSDWYHIQVPQNHYKKDDNDYYWLYANSNTSLFKNIFFVLPVKVLEDIGLFKTGYLGYVSFSMEREHIFHKYMFDYTNIDFDRFKKIIPITQTQI